MVIQNILNTTLSKGPVKLFAKTMSIIQSRWRKGWARADSNDDETGLNQLVNLCDHTGNNATA